MADGRAADDVPVSGLDDLVEVGRGESGTVYRARERDSGRTVALKVLHEQLPSDDARRRFERECRAMRRLSRHPHIVRVYGGGTMEDGRPYLLTEFLPNGSLADRMEGTGPVPWEEAVGLVIRIAGGLETAHRGGVLHRGLKPANVLTSRTGEPALADFGLARLHGGARTTAGPLRAGIAYAAPELLDGAPPTAQSDLYALAATLFALLSGRAPFVRETDQSLLAAIVRASREPVPDLRPEGVPPGLCAIVERALAKTREERYVSAGEFGLALQAFQGRRGLAVAPLVVEGPPAPVRPARISAPLPPRPPGPGAPPPARRRRVVIPLVLAVLVGLVAVAGAPLALRTLRSPPTPPAAPAGRSPPTAVISSTVTHPAAASVVPTLQAYVDGINERRYADAFALLGPDAPARAAGPDAFAEANRTTQILTPVLFAMTDLGNGAVQAVLRFTTTQAPEVGPDGQACTVWEMAYTMVPSEGDRWLIGGATPINATPRPC